MTPEPSDYPQGWYHVWITYAVGHKPAVVDIEQLAEILPHGSGIDADWRVHVRITGDVVCTSEYHAMDESGYTDWRRFKFVLARAKRNEYVALKGPGVGQYQITRVKGNVYFQSFTGGGDARDYLHDTCYWPVADTLHVHSMEQGVIVGSEMEAKSYGHVRVVGRV